MSEVAKLLRASGLFTLLDSEQVDEIAARFSLERHALGVVVFRESRCQTGFDLDVVIPQAALSDALL